jgi:hypothetical protein
MKTLQEQYNLIKEGKGNKEQFFKSARYLFPDMITPVNTFEDTVRILKNRGIIAEGIGGVVTAGKKQDWHAIFNENIEKLKEKKDEEEDEDYEKYKEMIKRHEEEQDAKHTLPNIGKLKEAKEVKAVEKETTKEVTDMATRSYDYKDTKNYDNVFGQEFLKGYYAEMKDPKNADKDVEELRAIVAKNLAKDMNYYVKDGQFGIKGVGYTTEAPGLGTPKEAKGKFKSSGYGDLKESVLRSQIYLLVKEVLAEGENKDLLKHRLGVLKKALEIAKKDLTKVDKDGKAYKEVEKTIAAKKREIEALEKEILDEGIHDRDITSASHTNVKGKMGDYDPKARAANLASLANFGPKSTNNFSEYSNDALADMIINLSRFQGNDEEIQMVKAELARRKNTTEAKKPSVGLTKKEKSAISKKAHAGKDIGKKGKGFEKVAKAAEKQYGSKEAGERVAAAAMWKSQAAKKK